MRKRAREMQKMIDREGERDIREVQKDIHNTYMYIYETESKFITCVPTIVIVPIFCTYSYEVGIRDFGSTTRGSYKVTAKSYLQYKSN